MIEHGFIPGTTAPWRARSGEIVGTGSNGPERVALLENPKAPDLALIKIAPILYNELRDIILGGSILGLAQPDERVNKLARLLWEVDKHLRRWPTEYFGSRS